LTLDTGNLYKVSLDDNGDDDDDDDDDDDTDLPKSPY